MSDNKRLILQYYNSSDQNNMEGSIVYNNSMRPIVDNVNDYCVTVESAKVDVSGLYINYGNNYQIAVVNYLPDDIPEMSKYFPNVFNYFQAPNKFLTVEDYIDWINACIAPLATFSLSLTSNDNGIISYTITQDIMDKYFKPTDGKMKKLDIFFTIDQYNNFSDDFFSEKPENVGPSTNKRRYYKLATDVGGTFTQSNYTIFNLCNVSEIVVETTLPVVESQISNHQDLSRTNITGNFLCSFTFNAENFDLLKRGGHIQYSPQIQRLNSFAPGILDDITNFMVQPVALYKTGLRYPIFIIPSGFLEIKMNFILIK